MSGGIVGYVMYDTTHYALHQVHTGFWAAVVGQKLKSSHMWHHYEDDQAGFGISSRLYDFILGTLPKRKQHAL
jgi:sterol desaturase/sphingolipid hydroxylase (fatty acid hydroxylase superfamily)